MLFWIALSIFGWFDWKSIKTDNFTVIYKPGYEWEATQTLDNLEYYRDRIISLTGNDPKRLWVVMEDLGMLVNGFADPVTKNIHIFTYPPDVSILSSPENWYRQVSVHEYTHICHLTKTRGIPSLLTFLFGPSLFQPNLFSPGWIMEGITVYSESQISPYEGRLNDGGFDSYIASKKTLPSITQTTYSPLEFPYGGIYLYGGEFFNYLASKYGEDRFSRFFATYGSYFWAPLGMFFPFFGIDMAAQWVYNKSFPSLYADWKIYEEEKYKDWRTDGKRLTRKGWYLSHLKRYENKLYYVREYPEKTDALRIFYFIEIMEMDLLIHKQRVIASLNSSVNTPLRVKEGKLYYTTLEFKRGYANVTQRGFGYTSKLHTRDLKTCKDKILFSDDIRAFCILFDGDILYSKDREHHFGSELWIYSEGKKEKLWDTDYLIGELEADTEYIVVSARKDFENWSIYLLDLDKKIFTPIVATPWAENSIKLSKDTLFFTANYDKTYSIYSYDLSEKRLHRLTQDGYAKFGETYKDTLYFAGLTEDGFDLYKRPLKFEKYKLKEWEKSPVPVRPEMKIYRGGYGDVFKTLFRPALRIPVVFPSDTTLRSWYLGGLFVGSDVTYENLYGLFFAYDPMKKDPILSSYLSSLFLSPLGMELNYIHKESGELGLSYPLLERMGPGLSYISLLLDIRVWEKEFSRRELTPGISVSLRYPSILWFIDLRFPIEDELWGSRIKRKAQSFRIGIREYVKGGELRTSFWGYNDPELKGIDTRGYKRFYAEKGIGMTIEYGHPILKIRKGFWNPNIFFEDLCGALFTDMALPIGEEFLISLGIELKLETGLCFGFLKFAPKVGLVVNREKEVNFYVGIEL